MIKVAFVIDDLGLGGAQRQLLELVKRLNRQRFTPIVVSLSEKKTALKEEMEKTGAAVFLIDQKGKISFPVLFRLFRIFKDFSPTIVHTYLFTADLYGRVAGKVAGVPILVSSVRSTEPNKRWHYIWTDRFLGKWCDAVVVNASCIAAILPVREKIERSKIHVIHNGVDLSRFSSAENGHLRKSFGISEKVFLLGTVGRLGPEKDHTTLLKALKETRKKGHDVVLFVVGDGILRSELIRQGEELGVAPYVHWLGPRADIPAILGGLDLFVLPSRYEGCPNVVLEAMAAGRGVIATRVGGTPELIRDGETGILVSPGDTDALVQALSSLVGDPRKLSEMGKNAREAVLEQFPVERMVEKTESLYGHLLRKKEISE